MARWLFLVSLAYLFILAGCTAHSQPGAGREPGPAQIAEPLAAGIQAPLPQVKVSKKFKEHWRDDRAELSGYVITTMRYGRPRHGVVVLVYVTEPMDGRVWVKTDDPDEHSVDVLKLNHTLNFRTGIYPYSVMTSVFSPVDGQGRERFAPAKISLTVQEWCGHVFREIFPKGNHLHSVAHSYFAGEGDRRETIRTEPMTLYEDALLIQLRELDGAFAEGRNWEGFIVPTLWSGRKSHKPPRPVPATITRTEAAIRGEPVTLFKLRYRGYTRTFVVEKSHPHRVLGWDISDGEQASILRTTRLPYWMLNGPGDGSHLVELGLSVDLDRQVE